MNPFFRQALGWITIVAVFFAILTYLLVMGLGVALVSTTQLGGDLSGLSLQGVPPFGALFIYFRLRSIPISINLLAYVWFLIFVFAVCFLAGFRSRGGFLLSLRKLPSAGRITRSSNWMVTMPLVSSALLVIVVIVTNLLNGAGVSSGTLCKQGVDCPSTAVLFAGLAHAPIGEELAYRILTPLALVIPIRVGWKRLVTGRGPSNSRFLSLVGLSILSPERAKVSAGYPCFATDGWQSIHWLEWIFIAVSSVLFGLAHIQPGGGTDWGLGKVVTAAISGVALAVVYVVYGAYANVLLHWFFDFYVEVLMVGLPISGGLVNIAANVEIFLGLFAVGTFSIAIGAGWLGKKIWERTSPTTYKSAECSTYSVQ